MRFAVLEIERRVVDVEERGVSHRLRNCAVTRSDGMTPLGRREVPIGSKSRGLTRSMPKSLTAELSASAGPRDLGPILGSVPVRKGPASERPDFRKPSAVRNRPSGSPREPPLSLPLGHSPCLAIVVAPCLSSARLSALRPAFAEIATAGLALRSRASRHVILIPLHCSELALRVTGSGLMRPTGLAE